MAVVDTTPHVTGAVPEAALRQVFHTTGLPEAFRLKLASQGVTELVVFANIADNMSTFKDLISTFFTEEELGAGPRRVLSLTRLANSWESLWRNSLGSRWRNRTQQGRVARACI